jgi:hypothetical protein
VAVVVKAAAVNPVSAVLTAQAHVAVAVVAMVVAVVAKAAAVINRLSKHPHLHPKV